MVYYMRYYFVLGILSFILGSSCTLQVTLSPEAKIKNDARVAFVEFKVEDRIDPYKKIPDIAPDFIDAFNSCLLNTSLTILDRHYISDVLAKKHLSSTDLLNENSLKTIGEALNADYLIIGNGKTENVLSELYLKTATIRMVDANTGLIVLSGFSERPSGRPTVIGWELGCAVADRIYYNY